jgi:hypothetical protein
MYILIGKDLFVYSERASAISLSSSVGHTTNTEHNSYSLCRDVITNIGTDT